jgi:hypothetical protein
MPTERAGASSADILPGAGMVPGKCAYAILGLFLRVFEVYQPMLRKLVFVAVVARRLPSPDKKTAAADSGAAKSLNGFQPLKFLKLA